MTNLEFTKATNKLKANWRFMFSEPGQMDVWWTYFMDIPDEDVMRGINRYILNNTKEPTISDLLDSIKNARIDYNKTSTVPYQSGRTISCIHCRDTGLIVWEDNDGRFFGRPCDKCSAGIRNYGEAKGD